MKNLKTEKKNTKIALISMKNKHWSLTISLHSVLPSIVLDNLFKNTQQCKQVLEQVCNTVFERVSSSESVKECQTETVRDCSTENVSGCNLVNNPVCIAIHCAEMTLCIAVICPKKSVGMNLDRPVNRFLKKRLGWTSSSMPEFS